MKLIDINTISYDGRVSDAELKARLEHEALEEAGFLDEAGKPLKGVGVQITRTGGRAGQGGYFVRVWRDMRQSGQPRLEGPKG